MAGRCRLAAHLDTHQPSQKAASMIRQLHGAISYYLSLQGFTVAGVISLLSSFPKHLLNEF